VTKEYSDLPGWIFELEEVSNGVYQVTGRDLFSTEVSCKGIDLDKVIAECRERVRQISNMP
jgi:hypothetical protein